MEQQRETLPSFHARGELSLELVHATEAAALACARLLGKGDPDRVSEVAGEAMRRGLAKAVSSVAAVGRGVFASLPPIGYVEKMVAGPGARGAIDLDDSIADNLRRIAFARDARVQDLTVVILDRPRHQEIITEVAAAGARVRTLEEGDFAGAVMAAVAGTGIDAAIGIDGLHATL